MPTCTNCLCFCFEWNVLHGKVMSRHVMTCRLLCRERSSKCLLLTLLGGSGVVISGVIRPLIWVIRKGTRLITLLITTLNPNP